MLVLPISIAKIIKSLSLRIRFQAAGKCAVRDLDHGVAAAAEAPGGAGVQKRDVVALLHVLDMRMAEKRKLRAGDIVSIDLGAKFDGYHGDNAATFACGDVSPEAKRLMDTTRESLYEGIRAACAGGRIGDIGHAVQSYVEARGYSVVRQFVGHGVGTHLHEAPEVPNFGTPSRGIRLMPGMTIAIEPMVNAGGYDVKVQPDGWTVLTKDGSLSAHFEHTIVITADGPKIMTVV